VNKPLANLPFSAPAPQPPQPGAVLVLQRWNQWVQVLDPATESTHWIDIGEVGFETVVPPRAD
jgi:hypothetical protein